jgi:SAM-dependent methyltransferase
VTDGLLTAGAKPPVSASSHQALNKQIASFRDPDGTVFMAESRIFRKVSASAQSALHDFLRSTVAQKLIQSGRIVGTREVPEFEAFERLSPRSRAICESFGPGGCMLEHDRIWFPSYAYEWPSEMLHVAAELTVELAEISLAAGYGLKDATPFNILFVGPRPVFVDILSFEKRDPGDSRWLPYEQFLRMFIRPLLMSREFGVRADEIFLSRIAGLQAEDVYARCPWTKRFRPPFLTTASIPAWLNRRVDPDGRKIFEKTTMADREKADFVLRAQLRRLRKTLRRVAPRTQAQSFWSSYMSNLSYMEEEFARKTDLVQRWISDSQPKTLLDIGCNTGHFSAIAARTGARVVALDLDPVVVGNVWRRAVAEKLDILPLVMNVAHPVPATGWLNAEHPSFLSRAAGSFDLVLMLAVIHHLLVTDRIPLHEILNLAAELTRRDLVIEYISKDDPLFRRLTRGRDSLHESYTQESFEAVCRRRFMIVERQSVKSDLRWLYLLRKHQD